MELKVCGVEVVYAILLWVLLRILSCTFLVVSTSELRCEADEGTNLRSLT